MTNSVFENSYTEKDYESIRNKLVEVIPNLTDNWTDFNESEPGMAYLEIAAGLTDMLCYYLDRQALENYLSTVEQRKNCQAILSVVGYKMYSYRSSICNVKFSIDSIHPYNIILPRYTRLIANKNTQFESQFNTMEDTILYEGLTEVNVNVKEGILKSKTITVSDINRFRHKLPDLAIAENSIKIVIKTGDEPELEEVNDIFLHGVGGLYFSITHDKDGYSWIHFMPDWKNHINVTENTELSIQYLVSKGVEGTAKTGDINEIYTSTIYDANEENVTSLLTVTNTENASGGSDPETVKEASYRAPRVVQTMWTAVTLKDFEVLAETLPGIRLVNAIDWSDHYGYYTTPSTVEICLVPEVGEIVSTYIKNLLLDLLQERKLVALDVVVIDPIYVYFDLNAKVVLKSRRFSRTDITDAIVDKLNGFYSFENSLFTKSIRKSKIISLIHEAHATIGYVELTSLPAWKVAPASVKVEDEVLGAAATKVHSGILDNTPVIPYSVNIKVDNVEIIDNGSGLLIGGVAGGQTNTIDYTTGAFEFTLQSTPSGAPVASYEYLDDSVEIDLDRDPLDDIKTKSNELAVIDNIALNVLYEDEVGD